jgi:hypothetical protein
MAKLALKFVTFPLVTFKFHVPVILYGGGITVPNVVPIVVVSGVVGILVVFTRVVFVVVDSLVLVIKDEIWPFAENVSSVVPIICANANRRRLESIEVKKRVTMVKAAAITNTKKITEKQKQDFLTIELNYED